MEFKQCPVEPLPGAATEVVAPVAVSPAEAMRAWSPADVKAFLLSRELRGLADACFTNGVNGEDLCALDLEAAVADLRLTPFAAKKLLAARAAFCAGGCGDGRSAR